MTTVINPTLQNQLNLADPNRLADILREMKLGDMLTGFKRTFTGLTGAATYNLTQLDATGETAGPSNPMRRAALAIKSLRVTAATTGTVVGSYGVTDSGGTTVSAATHTVMGVALLSDDGSTLTFPSADVTAFIIEYIPASAVPMGNEMADEAGPGQGNP